MTGRPLQIRPATVLDIDQLSLLAGKVLIDTGADEKAGDARRVFEHIMNSTAQDVIIVAENEARLCGYVYTSYKWLAEFGGETMDIMALFVDREWRSRGVGARLISCVLENARQRGICRIRAEVHAGNFAVERALEASGFNLERRTLWGRQL